ncbi:MAG: deoxyribose-phosphate aldolase [Firmicutes bacterium]|nr:deoxyribose-phosphate aldolase [Bacillota bacterium]
MEINDSLKAILAKVDHTLLSVTATWDEIRNICDDGIKYQTASVCIPPSFVKRAAEYVQGRVKICTVIGFPNGYSTAEVKAFEAKCAVKDGADEIDMVINQGDLKEGRHATILTEINRVKEACGDKILKVIIETCNLNDEEKVNMCRIVEQSDADFIKTSTGFGKGGATFEDIALFAENIKTKKIKAAGGIKTIADAEKFIELGADRLGTSRIVKIVKE